MFISLSWFSHYAHFSFALCTSLLWLSTLAPNSTICILLFSANSSFKVCCYCFSASHCTLPTPKPLQPSQLFIYTSTFYILTIFLQLHFSTFGVLLLICILHCCKYTHFISLVFFCLQCFFLIIIFAKVTMNRVEKKGGGEDATQSREERMQQKRRE